MILLLFLPPFQGFDQRGTLPQGFTLGYFLPLRWSFIRKFFFLKPNPDKPEPNRVLPNFRQLN